MFDTACQLIEEKILADLSDLDIAWDNVEHTPTRGTPFIRPIITQTANVLTAGTAQSGNYREHGLITIQVFTQAKKGARENQSLATRVGNVLRGYSVDRLYCMGPETRRVGERDEWFQSNINIPFYFDNCLGG